MKTFIKFMKMLDESLTSARKKFFDVYTFEKMYPKESPENRGKFDKYYSDLFEKFVKLDPSSSKKYLDWMVDQYVRVSNIDGDFYASKVSDTIYPLLIPWFHKNVQKLGDINQYKLKQLVDLFNSSEIEKQNGRFGTKKLSEGIDYNKVYEDSNNVVVFEILTFAGSRAIGGNSIGEKFKSSSPPHAMVSQEWCVTASNNHWNTYSAKGPLYFIMDLKNNTKYAFHLILEKLKNEDIEYINEGRIGMYADIYNVQDQHMPMYTVLGNLGLLKVFVKIAIEVANKYNEQQELTNWLFEACEEGSIDGVKKSIEHGAKDTKTQDCLMEAIKNNNYEIAKLLIDSKTSSASGSDNIPIFVACRMNCEGTDNLSIIDLLLKNGADPISYSHGGAISFVIKEDKGGSSVPLLKKLLNIDDKYPYYILLENLKSYFKVCVDLNIEECLKVILQLGFEKYDFEGEWSSYIYSCIKIIEGTIKRLLHPDFMSPERKNKAARNQKMVDIMKEYLAKYGEKA